MTGKTTTGLLVAGILLVLMGAMFSLTAAQDQPTETPPPPTPAPASDAYCLLCHTKPDQVWHLPSGETLSVTIDPTILARSVHGESSSEGPLACADCHTDFRYPHPATTNQTIRECQVERFATCRNCHEEQYTRAQDSVHGEFLREGRLEAATCVDCHGGHDIQTPDVPRQRISLTCGRCHGAIFEQYRTSVHGSALLDENNPDVPTCIDCHGVHDIDNPTTAAFRTGSPSLCATCHADSELMSKYNISTHVFDSYLAEFHGSTVVLFDHESEEAVTNKAVCFDCHGVHNIQAVDRENVSNVRETLLATCRQCHPGASTDFSSAWIGHYPATMETHPTFTLVNLFYTVIIPLKLGLIGLVVFSELVRRLRRRATRQQTGA